MNPIINQWGPVAVIVGGYLLGIYLPEPQHRRSTHSLDRRIDDLRDSLKSEVKRLEELLDHMDQRFDRSARPAEIRMVKRFDRLDDRLDRLEHPIVRQS